MAFFAGVTELAGFEDGGDFTAPPVFDDGFEFAFAGFAGEDDGGEGAVAHDGDAAGGGRGGEELGELGFEGGGLVFLEAGLGPVVDEGDLADVGGFEGPADGLARKLLILR